MSIRRVYSLVYNNINVLLNQTNALTDTVAARPDANQIHSLTRGI